MPPPSAEEMAALLSGSAPVVPPAEQDLAALRREIQQDPGNADAHYRLGQALQRQGQETAARQEFREALRLEPQHAGARRSLEESPE